MKRFDDTGKIDKDPRMHRRRMKYILRHLKRPPGSPRLLDVGCSFGMFVKVARENGFAAEGIEPAREAAEAAIKDGLDVRCGYLEDLGLPGESYDVVTLFEVIEHLQSPLPLLRECNRILKADGLFILSTGNTDSWTCKYLRNKWDYLDIKETGHVSWFNPASLSLIAEKAGCKVVKLYTRSVSLTQSKDKGAVNYRLIKIISETLQIPAKAFDKGHDAILVLSK
jgi:SAM-dependent methyltransferase